MRSDGVATGYRLGVDLGTTFTSAAVARDGRAEVISLGDRAPQIPSVILRSADGAMLIGEPAERRAVEQPDRVAREFKRRIGDKTNMYLAGTPMSPHALTGKLLSWVVDHVSRGQGGSPDEVVVTYPANWGSYRRELMEQAVSISGLAGARLCTEPEAAAVHFASTGRLHEGDVVAVYDLGGGTFDAAVLRQLAGGFAYVGPPEGIEQLGGVDFDDAVFGHVMRSLAPPEDAYSDPSALTDLVKLRRECTAAKEALSQETAVTIPVALAGAQSSVRLTRAEFEEMIRPPIEQTVDCLERVVRHAGLSATDLATVVLVGGSARIPLVTELVTARLGRPVAVSAHPKLCVAMGAALSGSEQPVASSNVTARTAPAPVDRGPVPFERPTPEAPPEPRRSDVAVRKPSPSRRTAGYLAAAAVLAILGLVVAAYGPESPVTDELKWDVASGTTDPIRGLQRGATMTPTILGVDLPGDPVKADAGRFQIGNGYKLFLAGPVAAKFDPAAKPRRLVRSGGAWWSPLTTIPGGAVVLGILFSFAYAESLLRVLRRRHGAAHPGELLGMAGVGAVVGLVVAAAAWIAGSLPTIGAVLFVAGSMSAAGGLLAVAVAGRQPRT